MEINKQYETRLRAQELQKESLAIWRQSDQSDYLDGIEDDPVFNLLMMAVAYQGNETDSEIMRLKEETLDEFARMLAPYEMGHATPASVVVQTAPNAGSPHLEYGEGSLFRIGEFPFMPLLRSRLFNVKDISVVRLDGRRWKVVLDLAQPAKELSGMVFAIDSLSFSDLTVSIGKKTLPLIKPWDYSELPFTECFDPINTIYNRQQTINFSMLPMDLFARHNVRMFIVDKGPASQLSEYGEERVELTFEFSGISTDTPFDKSHLLLNTMVLVNAEIQEATLTANKPFARIAGLSDPTENSTGRQFMHLLQPAGNQLFGNTEIEVRRMDADRFNQGSLVKLLNCIVNRFHSDFYAFQEIKGMNTDKMIYNLREALRTLSEAASSNPLRNTPGVYLLLKDRTTMHNKDFSLSVKYLTTAGAAANTILHNTDSLVTPVGFDASKTKIIAPPVQGSDEISSNQGIQSLLRYYMLTGDRIVTPADIKAFCRKELMARYGVDGNTITRIAISKRISNDRRDSGYEILVDITLNNNPLVSRTLSPVIPNIEILLQKMIEVRNANIYPVKVKLKIEN